MTIAMLVQSALAGVLGYISADILIKAVRRLLPKRPLPRDHFLDRDTARMMSAIDMFGKSSLLEARAWAQSNRKPVELHLELRVFGGIVNSTFKFTPEP